MYRKHNEKSLRFIAPRDIDLLQFNDFGSAIPSIENSSLASSTTSAEVDDYAGDTTTTGVISVGGDTTTGRINSGADVDWFLIENPTNTSALNLIFTSTSAIGMKINLVAVGPGGDILQTTNIITDINGSIAIILPDIGEDVTFYLEIIAEEDFAHDYTLILETGQEDDYASDTSTAGLVSPGIATTTGVIELQGDHDWFAFKAVAGQILDFALFGPNQTANYAISFTIRDVNGDEVDFINYAISDLYNQLTFIVQTDGTYYIDVTSSAGWSNNNPGASYGDYEIFPLISPLPSSLAPFSPIGFTPWAPLPSLGPRPDSTTFTETINIVTDVIYDEDSILYSQYGLDVAVIGVVIDGLDSSLINRGRIHVEDAYRFIVTDGLPDASGSWAYAVTGGNGDLFRNEGEVYAISALYDAAGFLDVNGHVIIENTGEIIAISTYANALGADTYAVGGHFNSGSIWAWAGGFASGFELENGGEFNNSGIIRADGYAGSHGVFMGDFNTTLTNSGTIIATAQAALSTGVFVFESNGITGQSNSMEITINNSGTIFGDYAIVVRQDVRDFLEKWTHITNTGTITGDILLEFGQDVITNDSLIEGNINMGGSNDIYNGANGQLIGTLSLGAGNDEANGGAAADRFFGGSGNDILSGDGGDDQIDGGSGQDTLTGGDGADYFIISNFSGNDIITDFQNGIDRIIFNNENYDFSQLKITQVGSDVMIAMSSGVITLSNTNIADIDESDFSFRLYSNIDTIAKHMLGISETFDVETQIEENNVHNEFDWRAFDCEMV